MTDKMPGRIMIVLETTTPDTGSGLPDLGHDAYWLMKHLPEMAMDDEGKKHLADKYRIVDVRMGAGPVPESQEP